jgi:hypothetical protein
MPRPKRRRDTWKSVSGARKNAGGSAAECRSSASKRGRLAPSSLLSLPRRCRRGATTGCAAATAPVVVATFVAAACAAIAAFVASFGAEAAAECALFVGAALARLSAGKVRYTGSRREEEPGVVD